MYAELQALGYTSSYNRVAALALLWHLAGVLSPFELM